MDERDDKCDELTDDKRDKRDKLGLLLGDTSSYRRRRMINRHSIA